MSKNACEHFSASCKHFSDETKLVVVTLAMYQGYDASCVVSLGELADALGFYPSNDIRILVETNWVHVVRRPGLASEYAVEPSLLKKILVPKPKAPPPPLPEVIFGDEEIDRGFGAKFRLFGWIAQYRRALERLDAWLYDGDPDRAGAPVDEHGHALCPPSAMCSCGHPWLWYDDVWRCVRDNTPGKVRAKLRGRVAQVQRHVERWNALLIYDDPDLGGPALDAKGRPRREVKNS